MQRYNAHHMISHHIIPCQIQITFHSIIPYPYKSTYLNMFCFQFDPAAQSPQCLKTPTLQNMCFRPPPPRKKEGGGRKENGGAM